MFLIKPSPEFYLGHGGGIIKRKSIMAVSMLLILALSFSTSTAFAATTNTSNLNSSQVKAASSTASGPNIAAGSAGTSQMTFNSAQINDASSRVSNFVGTNGRLPNYVTVGSNQVSMPQFLQLEAQNVVNINSGSSAPVSVGTVNSPTNPSETVKSGTFYKSEYVSLAQNVLSTMTTTGTAPNYVSSSLGNIRFESLIYTFSKVLNYDKTYYRLPNTVSVSTWGGEGSGSTISNGTTGTSLQSVIDSIGRTEANFRDVQGQSSASTMSRVGYGDCWADSEWLYNKLNAAGVSARIMGYVGGGTGAWYRHAWVQINTGSGWVTWNYAKYASQHHGDGLHAAAYVLIAPSKKIVDVANMVATGY